ncbi:transcriptional regulator, MarR family [Chitinophaga sp. CF118]|uniref:MarR family winged helix-turn-helix transcriptional regulator n=1 Tax=Chitinophaga sp. CF118 TaxID=1884367 RepID=UPI0008DF924D|nr:MarR family winged helix-turn-helix transcriptional regulator [Chitinophaga sp. CF118]SFE78593.1 transcriptional regulator, MarR family [Chitinophaga sp. CF118]
MDMDSSLDEQLEIHMAQRQRSLIRLLSLLKKDMDARITEKLQQKGYSNFKLGDLVLIVNIQPEGTINNELAKRARITKQAMSKVVKNLEAGGYILTRKHANDNRSSVIFLTDNGKRLLISAAESFREIQEQYTGIIGQKDTDALKEILGKLVFTLHPEYLKV